MKKVIFLLLSVAAFSTVNAQKYFTKSGKVNFFCKTAMENIDAQNKSATSVMDAKTGQLEFSVLMTGFEFEKDLMQKHFNENYVESEKFPKSTFKGKIDDLTKVDFTKDGSYTVNISGTLEMHGQKKDLKTTATFVVKAGKVSATSTFDVRLEDYKIKQDAAIKGISSSGIKVTVNVNYELFKAK
jgi:polyisoprenoid-binding protein YceI